MKGPRPGRSPDELFGKSISLILVLSHSLAEAEQHVIADHAQHMPIPALGSAASSCPAGYCSFAPFARRIEAEVVAEVFTRCCTRLGGY